MSRGTVSSVTDAAESILGDVEGINISAGLLGVTVLLGGDPVATITPVGGIYLVKLLKALDAVPPTNEHVTRVTTSRDPDWVAFQTPRMNDVRAALHRARPRLEWRSGATHRLDDELDGVKALDINEADAKFWQLLATWAEASGALPRARNLAKWARIYGGMISKGKSPSDRFAEWGAKTAREARETGFRPLAPRRSVLEESKASPDVAARADRGKRVPAVLLKDRELVSLLKQFSEIDRGTAQRLAASSEPSDEAALIPIRAIIIRVLSPAARQAIREAVGFATATSVVADGLGAEGGLGSLIDAAYAVAAKKDLGPEAASVLSERWRAAARG